MRGVDGSNIIDVGRESLHIARHVTWVGFWWNAILGLLKVIAGIIGRSTAMVVDGVHSFTDFFTDIIVLVFIGISHKKANIEFQYGHGKFETFATMLLAMVLVLVGVLFLYDGAEKAWRAFHGQVLPRPSWIALGMAVFSIVIKEWLYRYTRHAGEKIKSPAIVANAWHHRSDAMSSLATLIGIAGAMFLGENFRILDPLAAVIVSVFIIIVALKIGRPAVEELLEVSLPQNVVARMYDIISHTPGVMAFHRFASRKNGSCMIVDFHIKVDPHIDVIHAHRISTDVERLLKQSFGNDMLITIHIEPYLQQNADSNGACS